MEISTPQASPDVSMTKLDQLAKEFSHLSISDLTRAREVVTQQDSHSKTFRLEVPSEVQVKDLLHFPLGLHNSASIFQDTISFFVQSKQEIPLTGAQKGQVLSITLEGGIVHWLGARPDTSSTDPSCLVGMVELLPYQDGNTLLANNSEHGSTKIVDSAMTAQSGTHSATRHSREVFMAGQPPQIPMPNPPRYSGWRRD
jgi:hypothetical protein